jgi:hypothetical protein
MSELITLSDPVISFDQQPGRFALIGQRKPAAVVAQIEKVDEAWREYNACVDEHLTFCSERTQLNMTAALKAAQKEARKLDELQQGAELPEDTDDTFGLRHPGALM